MFQDTKLRNEGSLTRVIRSFQGDGLRLSKQLEVMDVSFQNGECVDEANFLVENCKSELISRLLEAFLFCGMSFKKEEYKTVADKLSLNCRGRERCSLHRRIGREILGCPVL